MNGSARSAATCSESSAPSCVERPLASAASASARGLPTLVGQLEHVGHGGVGQREGRRPRHGARHVGDAVEHGVVNGERGIVVRGGPRVLEAATLVDRDVDEHGARLHVRDSRIGDQLGGLGARHQDGADHQVGLLDGLLEFESRRVAGLDGAAVLGVDLAQRVDVEVEHGDVGAHTPGDGGGVVAGHSAADHHDFGRSDAGDAAHEYAATALGAHQVVGADLCGQAARDLAHRSQQRQRAVSGLHGLVGDGGGARRHQRVGARPGRREVQVGEQRLALAHPARTRPRWAP